MPDSIEQFTAPGKYYYELSKEIIEAELKNPSQNYSNYKPNSKKECSFKDNPYYNHPRIKNR